MQSTVDMKNLSNYLFNTQTRDQSKKRNKIKPLSNCLANTKKSNLKRTHFLFY